MPAPTGEKLVADNRRARYEYNLLERVEAGIVLTGTEVKSLREGRVTLTQAYAEVRDGEVWLYGMSIAIYDKGGHANHEPDRPRKLPGEYYELTPLGTGMVGRRSGATFRLGDPIAVTVERIEHAEGKVELALPTG